MWIDIDQNTDEWLELRVGKVTGSQIACIMAKYGGDFGDPAKRYAVEIALGQITGRPSTNSYSNSHMDRGHKQEPIARSLYEEFYFCDVSKGGFFDNKLTGCSPDGLIFKDGVLEIKSVIGSEQSSTIKAGGIPSKYKWQCCFNLRESHRDFIDYTSYSSDYPEGNQLYIHRSTRDDFKKDLLKMHVRLAEFHELVEMEKQIILNGGPNARK